ncbi:hypothetical protein ACFV4E_22530 [Streptomyces hygroscopicus]|uniref:Terminase small subunit n=1 Tax=Streptomyces hygroscopicus TaxID=1912 RepID=A0ABQ3UF84_STRHY|nr:hypothetical protein [Streptomyces hygroscopicus]GHJ34243.1 hypothetical protein TPA0910_86760 [Streptomyces hygroscopicus]
MANARDTHQTDTDKEVRAQGASPDGRRARYAAALYQAANPERLDSVAAALPECSHWQEQADAAMAVADAEFNALLDQLCAEKLREAADKGAALDRRKIGIHADTIRDAWEEGRDEVVDLLRGMADESGVGASAKQATKRPNGMDPVHILGIDSAEPTR